jgi:hypothetical protein
MKWLTGWLIVRGCNVLVPHAFYYSVRGPRIDERPPDVGPNSPWWGEYKPFADASSRLCWLNTDSEHVCSLAILGLNDYLPWEAAKVCFRSQRDFNYLEARHLWEDARPQADGVHIAGMHYKALVVEFDPPDKAKESLAVLERAGRLIRWDKADGDTSLLAKIDALIPADARLLPPTPDLRLRHVVKEGIHYYIIFNEGQEQIEFRLRTSAEGQRFVLDPETGRQSPVELDAAMKMQPHELKVLKIAAPAQAGTSLPPRKRGSRPPGTPPVECA